MSGVLVSGCGQVGGLNAQRSRARAPWVAPLSKNAASGRSRLFSQASERALRNVHARCSLFFEQVAFGMQIRRHVGLLQGE